MLKKLKYFLWHKQQTETYSKIYICGVCMRKKIKLRQCFEQKISEIIKQIQQNQADTTHHLDTLFITALSEFSEKLDRLQEQTENSQNKYTELLKQTNNLCRQSQLYFNELNYANLLHDTIIQSSWLKEKSFSLFGWAANYSFIYTLYRILDKLRPLNILEMGLGQTTRLTSQYITYNNLQAKLIVCEHNADWIDVYRKDLPNTNNLDIHHFDLEYFDYEEQQNDKYSGLLEYVKKQKFDLIIVDGPVGGNKNLPRSNILDLIRNDNLADNFVIIFDDAERTGEQKTISLTQNLLKEKAINFTTYERCGIKRQHIITSTSYHFTRFL